MAEQLGLGWFTAPPVQELAPGALLLRGFALEVADELLAAVCLVTAAAPFRHLITPGGFRMSVGMTNCGGLGWVSDRAGYRYSAIDPASGSPWPAMPRVFLELARAAASRAGFPQFWPDACLVNRYEPGARMTLHQDRNEHEYVDPIVSVSLGLPATFLFGGNARSDKAARIPLVHGDVVVWGGPSRMRFHGVLPLAAGHHAQLGGARINLTFRKAGR